MTTNDWAPRTQGVTLITADAHGERWTRDEVDFVVAMTNDETDADIAIALGRSLYAVWALQHRVRTEGVAGIVERLDRQRVAPVVTCPDCWTVVAANGACAC